MKTNKSVLPAIIFLMVILAGCSEDEPAPFGSVNLDITVAGENSSNSRMGSRTKASVVFEEFQISIRDVIFKTDADDDGISDDSTEVAFRGPYQLNLLDGGDAIKQTIGTEEIPNGLYDELRFKFHKDEDLPEENPLFDRSIYIAGTIDGTPFEMWHDTSENLDIGKNTGGVLVDGNEVNLTIVFPIDLFLTGVADIDLGKAVDGNEDGIIQINTNDEDGNKEIADALKENIKAAADLLDSTNI